MARPKCPDCGAPKGDPHDPSCKRASPRRRPQPKVPRQGENPYGQKCPPHNPSKIRAAGDGQNYWRCSKCRTYLGKW